MKRPLCMGCLFFLILVWLGLRLLGPPDNPFREYAGKTLCLEGVVEWKEEKNGKQILYLKNVRFSDGGSHEETEYGNEKTAGTTGVICSLAEGVEMPPLGSTIRIQGRLSLYRNATNPGEFDQGLYYLYKGYGGRVSVNGWRGTGDAASGWREALWQFRRYLGAVYTACLPEEDAGVMKAMVLGDKGELSADIRDLYRMNGIAHILAISGLHISILGSGLYKGLRKATVPILPAAAAALLLMTGYACMTGAGISTVRAVIMFGLQAGADVERRSYDLPTALALSAASTVFFSPWDLMLSAFWMSYGAVMGIAVFYPALVEGVRFGKNKSEKLLQAFLGSLSVTAFTLPLILLNYYETPVYSVLLNLIVVPLMTFLMIFGLLVLLTGSIYLPAGVLAGLPCHLILQLYAVLCRALQRLPLHTYIAGCPSGRQILSAYLLFGLVLLAGRRTVLMLAGRIREKGKQGTRYGRMLAVIGGESIYRDKPEADIKRLVFCRGICSFLGVLAVLVHFRPQAGITILDVGQGDGICFESTDLVVMLDGGSTSKDALFQYQIGPFLKYRGIAKVDYWFITHPDTDHCSALIEMLEDDPTGIRIGTLVLPDAYGAERDFAELTALAEANGIPVLWNAAGSVLQGEHFRFLCLHPSAGYVTEDVNSYSQVLEVSGEGFTGLFTGDATTESEADILRRLTPGTEGLLARPEGGYFCLKLGHHGSHTSTSQAFLEFASPQIALVSCGLGNSYGHPHTDVMERVEDMGCDVFRTDEGGAVIIRAAGGRITVEQPFLGVDG